MGSANERTQPALGRYVLGHEIASGGMAAVHVGTMLGPAGFVRTVAIKRMHPNYAKDPEFVSMFLDEARLAARVQHPNVVSTLDVVAADGELFLVMEYVRGESIAALSRAAKAAEEPIPVAVALGVMSGVLCGLHAAHEAKTERDEPLCIIHRDVSPQNILVGADGVARLLDFGIAKARFRLHSTHDGRLKGKLRYMAPEQLCRESVDRRCDVYAASVVLWEMLTGRKLFDGDAPGAVVEQVLLGRIAPPGELCATLPEGLDSVVLRGLASRPEDRFPTALAMAEALEKVGAAATHRETGQWVLGKAERTLAERAAKIVTMQNATVAEVRVPNAPRRAGSRSETEVLGDSAVPRGRGGLVFDVAQTDPGGEAPAPPRAPATRRWRRSALLSACAATIGAVALAMCAIASSARSTQATTPISSAAASIEPALAVPTAPARDADPTPSAPVAPVASSRPVPSSAPGPSARPRLALPPRAECDPPYIVDAQGHKQYKAKCL